MQNEQTKNTSHPENLDQQYKLGFKGHLLLLGVILPVIALGVELFTAISAEVFVDPIPTLIHVLLIGFVPAANIYLYFCLAKGRFERATLFGWTSAIAIGIAIVYSLLFLPVSPISVIGIIAYGLGFLGLSPMFAWLSTFLMRKHFRKATGNNSFILSWKGALVGFLIAFSIVAVSESRFLITKHGLELASSESVENQKRGLELIKNYGDENYLLRLSKSYKGTFYISDTVYGLLSDTKGNSNSQKAGEIFYRLSGDSADEIGMPNRFGFGETTRSTFGNRHISLYSSEFDGSIDNEASLGYVEWIFEFQNNDKFSNAEAVGQIQLPPDSVVSRVTLWINGEEREAAYAERTKVTEAYEKVVSANRDPVLVTTSGKDRVEMKCFPIPPNGGKMKVKIGITYPLQLESTEKGIFKLPYFRSKNFKINEDFQHKLAILSTDKLETSGKELKFAPEDKYFVMRGNVLNENIENSSTTISAKRSEENTKVWANYDDSYIKQEIVEQTIEKPARFVFAIDTSIKLKDKKEQIISAIEKLPKDSEIGLILTHGNGLNTEISYPKTFTGNPNEIAEKIKQAEFGGGTDNLPTLAKAWDLAKESNNGVVIWIHAPQPFNFVGSEELVKKLVRRSNETQIYNFTIGNGTDVIENQLVELDFLDNAKRLGELQSDLNNLFQQLDQSKKTLEYARTIDTQAKKTIDDKASKHLIRLWAFDEVNEILASEKDERAAIDLALKYQLVTPVTGAVVLETKEQYDEAGLKPKEKNNVVHAVPEPETYFLLLIGLGLIIFVIRKQII